MFETYAVTITKSMNDDDNKTFWNGIFSMWETISRVITGHLYSKFSGFICVFYQTLCIKATRISFFLGLIQFSIVYGITGADQGFSLGGGGAQQIMWVHTHAHHEREAQVPYGRGPDPA